jgi:hypothetical protein
MAWQLTVLEWSRKTGYWLLTTLGLIALWGATGASLWSAMEAKRTADTIAKMEQQRLDYERNRYTADIFAKYAEFIGKNRPFLPCARALNVLDEDQELRNILDEPSEFDFHIDDPRHRAVLDCLDKAERDGVLEQKVKWSNEHRREVRGVVIDWANETDAMVLAFNYKVANLFMLCRNFSSFTMQKEPGQVKLLFDKIKRMEIWQGVPNLWEFMDQFKSPRDCSEFPGKPKEAIEQVSTASFLSK